MKKIAILLWALLAGSAGLRAQSGPTYAGSVAGILYQNCTSCHHTGGIAPFPLESYASAVPRAASIKDAVLERHMPPWPPDPGYSRFHGERTLTKAQIDSIVAWVDAGTPRGNAATEPPVPVFSDESKLTYPADTLFQLPTYTIITNQDLYRCFLLPAGVSVQKFIRGIELVAGNKEVVHHMLLYADTTGLCRQLDAADPGPGYTNFGGTGSSTSTLITGWAPGADPVQFPAGFGMRITPRTDLIVQIHYAPGSLNQKDSTYFRLSFAPPGTTKRLVYNAPILNYVTNMVNGPLQIEANQKKVFMERFTSPIKATLMSVFPHAHLVCSNWKVYGIKPITRDTLPIIKIPDWHFHWQGYYTFQKPFIMEPGMRLEAQALYDNTTDNPDNPYNPPRTIVAGENTTDEMMLVYFTFAGYQAGDENLDLNVTSAPKRIQQPRLWWLKNGYVTGVQGQQPDTWELRGTDGRLLLHGVGSRPVPLAQQAEGVYLLYVQDRLGMQALRVLGGSQAQ
jgi:mono/diheme cytochrome c family protein